MYSNTKMKFTLLDFAIILFVNFAFAQSKPTHFKTDIDFGGGTIISTFLDAKVTNSQFSITSPKDADVRIMGSKAKLGRVIGKAPKKGIIVTINGQQKADSLFGDTKIPMFGKLKFKGMIKNEILSGSFLNNDGVAIGTLHGVSSTENKIGHSYLYPLMMTTIRDNIYAKDALQNKDWTKFEKDIKKLCDNAHDDIELFMGFNILSQNLPFTHLTLAIMEETAGESDEKPSTTKSVVFEEKNSTTAYLQVKNFSQSEKELLAILPEIVANKAYKTLIIDLRDNGGGGISPAFALAKYIVTDDMEVGYFPTNKLQYSGYQPELFKTLPEVQPKSTEAFGNELRATPGVKLVFKKPDNAVFAGKLYVLTNGGTGSTCEPIVYALKQNKKATIVGENTYGGMLAASPYVVSGKYSLMIPIADFYTADGVRLDKVGVSPDVEVKSEDALSKALEIISSDKN